MSKNSKTGYAFDMPAMVSCPGATAACTRLINPNSKSAKPMRACYALQSRYALGQPIYQRNMDNIRQSIEDNGIDITADAIVLAIRMHEVMSMQPSIRFHGSGDVFSYEYGMVLAAVASKMPDKHFWMYSRSYVVPTILAALITCARLPNFDVWLSADHINNEDATDVFTSNPVFSGIACMQEAGATWIAKLTEAGIQRKNIVVFAEHVVGRYAKKQKAQALYCPEIAGALQEGPPACQQCPVAFCRKKA